MLIGDERLYWLGFSVFPGIGPKKFSLLIQEFKTAKESWEAREDELSAVLGLALTKKFIAYRPGVDLFTYSRSLDKANVWYILSCDPEYPQLLKEIADPPFVLYGKGDQSALAAKRKIGVVGTRKITNYGRQVTEMVTREMVSAGYAIVSGLAMGVDAIAHATTLAEKGKTIAVLGCGVDCCSPQVNEFLYRQIITNGSCVVSEFPLSQSPTPGSFPSRNRIIAGLSQAVVVTEGAVDSGALITASDALKNNRPVFAIPGPITSSLSKGPNKLLREGAVLVSSTDDILRELGVKNLAVKIKTRDIQAETKEEQQIIDVLRDEEMSFDTILSHTACSSSALNMQLSLMELKGIIGKLKNGMYHLKA